MAFWLALALHLTAAHRPPAPVPAIAVLGVDNGRQPFASTSLAALRRRTDSIVLIGVGATRDVGVLWIPRDTLVRFPDGHREIVAHAAHGGGVALLDRVLAANFGVQPIGHVVLESSTT